MTGAALCARRNLSLRLRRAGLATTRLAGISYDWRSGEWRISDDLSVNYMLVAVRR